MWNYQKNQLSSSITGLSETFLESEDLSWFGNFKFSDFSDAALEDETESDDEESLSLVKALSLSAGLGGESGSESWKFWI